MYRRSIPRGLYGGKLDEGDTASGDDEPSDVASGSVGGVPAKPTPSNMPATNAGRSAISNEPPCEPSVEACNAARTGFALIEECASAALCVEAGADAACAAPACEPGETRCRSLDVLLTCNADQTGFDSRTCSGLLTTCSSTAPAACRGLF